MKIRSSLPGRVRWEVPPLLRRPEIAAAVARDLERRSGVTSVVANPLTAGVLLQFDPRYSADDTREWLEHALDMVASTPAAVLEQGTALERHGGNGSGARTQPPLLRLFTRTQKHRKLGMLSVGTSFANGLSEAIPPILIGTAVDIVTRRRGSILGAIGFKTVSSQLFALGGMSLVFWVIDAGIGYAHRVLSAEFANTVRHDLRNELYEHLQTLDLKQIESRPVSEWMAVLDRDVNQVHHFIEQGADPAVAILANGVIVGATFLVLSPAMAAAQLLLVPPLVIASMALLKPIRQRFIAARTDAEALTAVMLGNVSGMATITAFNTQAQEAARTAAAGERHLDSSRRAFEISAAYVPTLQMIVGVGFVTTLVWGGALVNQGRLAPGAYDVMGYTELRLLVALARMGVSLENYQRTKAALDRIFRTLDSTPTIQSGDVPLPLSSVTGNIAFEHVVFGYEADRPVLKGISMKFPAGRTVGIVGATGAGKSTILKLILRFYDIQSGAVRLDDVNVADLKLDQLRQAIAMVPQDIVLFAGTIRDNVAYAKPEATPEDIEQAARIAEAHGFIEELPQGYDTPIGHGGLRLSGGQRQRIAIARAVLADRPILLFDEATSSLDHETEAAIQRSLETVTKGRTTIIVAHRLSTIRHADLIYVLDDGQVKEMGQHDELVAADGIYASMWRVQTGEARNGAAGQQTGARGKPRVN